MARFDKFDAERKANAEPNGIVPSIEDGGDGGGDETSLPAKKEQKRSSSISEESTARKTTSSHPNPNQESDGNELSEVKDSPPPKKKKTSSRDSDAAFAAQLQAFENSRIRSTRGGGPKVTPAKKKKTPKKKTSAKVKAEDDSDMEGSASEVKERKYNKNNGFHVSRGFLHQYTCLTIR